MFLRRNRRTIGGELYEYWTLVESHRTERGPRQRVVATLGKVPGLDEGERRGWEEIGWLLEGRRGPKQMELGAAGEVEAKRPDWAQVDLSGVRVERVRDFGAVYLALSLWRRLGLHELLAELIGVGREDVGWDQVACALTAARFCAQRSELEVAERWYKESALEDLLGVALERVNASRLYRGLDVLRRHKEALCAHLMERYRSWFGVGFEFLLYDVTSTFFEGRAAANAKAARGYSRDNRPDCRQVCIGLVVSPEGLPLAYEVFAGNRADVTTVEEIVGAMEARYGQAGRIWVMDRGMVSEENIAFLRARNARYIVGTPKAQLRRFERQLLEKEDWAEVVPGVEVKMIAHPDGAGAEQFVLCRSAARKDKEAAMLRGQFERLLGKLQEIDRGLRMRPGRDAGAIERRVGRWLGRFTGAETMVDVVVLRDGRGAAIGLDITRRPGRLDWASHAHGAYLLRTNCTETDPAAFWKWYMQLGQAESAFRTGKSDLGLRPVFHQKTHRVEAHILVCFLALALWRTLEMWMRGKGLGTCARQLLKEVNTVRSMDVVLPVKDRGEVRLRVVAKPERPVAELLHRLGVILPNAPKLVENVVEKITP
ncbi:MAG TPA: IS1634 family transposase [Opitutaceae bacterium]|nr:MAG: Transposase DDE domain protein [Verrucomicrobia bacterium ADurb.Bin122]HQF40545.1 IS1634 family transposase [Opitutaceae bacterium]